MKNTLLQVARRQKGWSQQQLADFAGVGLATVGRAERGDSIRIDNIQRLCACLDKTPDQLGLVRVGHTDNGLGQRDGSKTIDSAREVALDAVGDTSSPGQNLHRLTEDQSLALTTLLKLGETIMFDPKKREMLQTLLTALSFAAVKPQGLLQPEAWQHFLSPETDATRVNEATMQGFEKLMAACWRLSWGNELALAEELLPSCMSRLVPLAQQPSKYQQTTANLAAQGFRLYGIFALHRNDLLSRELYYKQAVQYSLLSGDTPLIITAFIGQGDTYYYMKNQYGTALQAYQNALPYAKEASPLFQSKVYLSLAVASAHMDQKQDSLRFLGLAHDTFPDRPETDASFSYAEHNRSHMILGEGIMRSQLGQTNMALDIFARAEHPDIIIPERLRVEIFNQQAKTAIISGDLEQGSAYVEAGVTGARTLSSQKRYNEAYENFKQLSLLWPQEKQVKALADVFQSH